MNVAKTTIEERAEGREHQRTPLPHFLGKEVGGPKDGHMDTDEFLPRRGCLAYGGRLDAVALQDVPHGLVADTIAQVRQSADDAVIPPRAVLSGHPHHEVFDLLGDARAANGLVELDTIILLGCERAVPSQDCVWLGNRRNLFQSLFAQLLAKLGECFAIADHEVHTTADLLAENTILGYQVRIAQPEFFVNRLGE
jgi:hypothetical protein